MRHWRRTRRTRALAARHSRRTSASAIEHLEKSLETPVKQTDIDIRALLSRLYVAADQFDKAIPLLTDIVKEAPSWRDGPSLLMEAYSGAGKNKEAVDWLEETAPDNPQLYSTLAGFYARERRWVDAATAYEQALKVSPRSFDIRVNLASMLMNTGSRRRRVARARCPARSDRHSGHRRTRADAALAGRAPRRRPRRGRSDGPQG